MYGKRNLLLLVILLICFSQVLFITHHVLSSGMDSDDTPPQVLLREPAAMDDQLLNSAEPEHKTYITSQPIRGQGRNRTKKLLLDNATQIKRPRGLGSVMRQSDNVQHCRDEVCSDLLEAPSLQCYLFCEQLTRLRTLVSSVDTPKHCKFRESKGRVPVALVSVPGSGNTWVRGLLEKATGVCTGSIYCDSPLRIKGFVGENVRDGSVLIVKTHTSDYQWRDAPLKKRNIDDSLYSSAILLIRNPFDTFVAERHRSILVEKAEWDSIKSDQLYGIGKIKHEDGSHVYALDKEEAFGNRSNWTKFSHNIGKRWQKTIIEWSLSNHSILVVRYEDLKKDSLSQITRMLDFLNHNYNRTDLVMKLKGGFTEFRRDHRTGNYEHYTKDQKEEINALIMDTINTLKAHNLDHLFQIRDYIMAR